jgi:molybdopterin/thiamine biosynthesis adenylyltransferase
MATNDRRTEKHRTFTHLARLLDAEFSEEMRERRLRVVVGEGVLSQEAGQALVLTVARLAPRIAERIDFRVPTAECITRLRPLLAADTFSGEVLADLARLIWDDGEFSANSSDPVDATLGIGAAGDVSVGVSIDGAALVVPNGLVPVARADGLEAAIVAAAVGCAQVTRRMWPEIFAGHLDQITFAAGPLGGPVEPAMPVVLARPVFAGIGAVGCASIYALIVLGATGEILLLDPDDVSDSNLMRYILFDSRHLNITKTEAASQIVAATGLDLHVEHDKSVIQKYLKTHPEERERLELVVSAVDTYDARREIAGELPRQVVNAGTTPRDFTVSRHGFSDGYACLACLYPPRQVDVELAAVIARELGLEKTEVEQLRRTKAPLTEELITRVAQAHEVDPNEYSDYVGEPIDTFYNKVGCAAGAVKTERGEAVAPLAHGSALAGFLLARLVADPVAEYRHFRLDFVSGLGSPMRTNPRPRDDCLYCGNPTMRDVYQMRWG